MSAGDNRELILKGCMSVETAPVGELITTTERNEAIIGQINNTVDQLANLVGQLMDRSRENAGTAINIRGDAKDALEAFGAVTTGSTNPHAVELAGLAEGFDERSQRVVNASAHIVADITSEIIPAIGTIREQLDQVSGLQDDLKEAADQTAMYKEAIPGTAHDYLGFV